jgi:uncharacterized protein (TIGR00369 family)
MKKQPNSAHCIICGVQNSGGVHASYYETTNDAGEPEVFARFTGHQNHQSYPNRMHGGIITGILDETIGRAINIGVSSAEEQVWGVTVEIEVKFYHPVPLDVELTARGRITSVARRLFVGTGELYLPDGTIAASCTGKYIQLPIDQIAPSELDALGWRVYPDEQPA